MNNSTFMQWIEASPFRKNIAVLILVFIALALMTTTVLLYKHVSHFGTSENYPQTISVSGKAEEYVKPDTLTFSITANAEGKDVMSTSKKVDDQIKKAIDILKANGVEEKNIKTTSREINDIYGSRTTPCPMPAASADSKLVSYPECNSSVITGVSVYQSLEVRVPDIDKDTDGAKREKMVADLNTAGIKTGQMTFTVYDLDEVKVRVRAEAIKKARDDAKELADSLDVDLEQLQSFVDSQGGMYPPYMSARPEMANQAMMKDSVSSIQLPTGEQKVVSEVTLTYLIK